MGTTTDYKNDYDYHWAPGTAQYQWLVADLAAHPSVLKFAFFHYPLLSDNPNEATDTYLLGSSSLEGLLKQNGVDIAFTGHSHIYERNLPSAAGYSITLPAEAEPPSAHLVRARLWMRMPSSSPQRAKPVAVRPYPRVLPRCIIS